MKYMFERVEEPHYEILESLKDGVEIREYKQQIWAITNRGNESSSFGALASYIFGENDRKEKIGMTAPVVTTEEFMAFVMPNRYNMESLPKPLTGKIRIDPVSPRRMAIIKFSGFSSPERNEKHLKLLLNTLKNHGIEPWGQIYVLRYNPPWTPPFMRRNEVAIEVRK
jgi:SOUL heme-binding protein